jgi:hypothetical protein
MSRKVGIDIRLDRPAVRPGDEFYVAVGPPEIAGRPDPGSVALAITVDASGSMGEASYEGGGPPKWDLVKDGFAEVLRRIAPETALAIVVFTVQSRLVFEGSASQALTRGDLLDMQPNGLTDIGEAIRASVAALQRLGGVSRRVIFLSDGMPTDGIKDPVELARIATAANGEDIYFDTIGYGAAAGIDLLTGMAGPNGMTEHIRGNAEDAAVIGKLLAGLARIGQGAIVSGGHVDVEVHPEFQLVGVYQAHPEQKRYPVDPAEGKAVRLSIGAQGAGEARTTYLLRLRAPAATTSAPIRILAADGVLRFGQGRQEDLQEPDESRVSVAVRADAIDYNPRYKRIVDEIDEAARVRAELAGAKTDKEKLEVHRAGRARAQELGFEVLVANHEQAIQALEEGLDPRDVESKYVTTSRKSTTKPSDLLANVPFLDPNERPSRGLGDL